MQPSHVTVKIVELAGALPLGLTGALPLWTDMATSWTKGGFASWTTYGLAGKRLKVRITFSAPRLCHHWGDWRMVAHGLLGGVLV